MSPRRALGVLGVVLAAMGCLLAAPASAQTSPTSTTLAPVGPRDCGSKSVIVLFWPSGHPAIAGVGFSNFPIPHSEVYVGGSTTYPTADFLAYFDYQGHPTYAARCTPASLPSSLKKTPSRKRMTDTTVLTCKGSKVALLDIASGPGGTGYMLRVVIGKVVEATEQVGTTGSTLTFDKKLCKVGAALK